MMSGYMVQSLEGPSFKTFRTKGRRAQGHDASAQRNSKGRMSDSSKSRGRPKGIRRKTLKAGWEASKGPKGGPRE